MVEMEKAPERKRRDWIIILIILLIGFLCVILAGEWAIRFSPTWKMDTNMGSNIDPDSVFLTSRPSDFLEPLDPSILTQPGWIDVFLTPSASFLTGTPVTSLPTNTTLAANTTIPTAIISPTRTAIIPTSTAIIPSPTNTIIYFPPPTNTPKPPPPAIPVDFSITKTDGVTTYTPGSTLTYTVVVTNNSTVNVNGVTVSDTKPSQVTTWGWCVAPCAPTAKPNANLSTTVNLAAGNSITYIILANIDPGATGNLVNTASVSVPSGYIDTKNGNNSATDTDIPFVPPPTADLSITKTDGVIVYEANGVLNYTIIVTNNGPDDVTGATVTDNFPAQISSVSWTCSGSGVGASCAASGPGNISDSTVNIPSGMWVTYNVTATVSISPSGNLVNTATVTEPGSIYDPAPGNNSASDTDQIAVGAPYGNFDFGNPPSGSDQPFADGSSVVIALSTNIVVVGGSEPTEDLIIFEEEIQVLPLPPQQGIAMDHVIVDIGDGTTWYTVFYWGDGVSDTNTNVATLLVGNVASGGDCNGEPDNCNIHNSLLYPNNGITIDVDSLGIPPGSYSYLRITAPSGGDNDGISLEGFYIP